MKRINKCFNLIASIVLTSAIFAGCNAELNQVVADATINSQTETTAPGICRDFTAVPGNGCVVLNWKNPNDADLYGVTVSISAQNTTKLGSLSDPVTLLGESASSVPSTLKVSDLENGETYSFTIIAFDKNLNKSIASSTQGIPTTSVNTNEVSGLIGVAGSQWVELSWAAEKFKNFYGFKIQVAGNDNSNKFIELPENGKDVDEYIDSKTGKYTYMIENLTNDIAYSFTVQTILKNENQQKIESAGKSTSATPNTGDSGIYSSTALIDYKRTLKAYEMGFHDSIYTEELEFTSSSELDLSKTVISFDNINNLGKGSFEVTGVKNLSEPSRTTVTQGQKFSVTVKYTPATSASWDECDLLIGGSDGTNIRLIATNFKTPREVTDNSLRLWLRADMISQEQLTDTGFVKTMPDASGNSFDAVCSDDTWEYAPKYVENADNGSDDSFNFFPYIDFSQDDKTRTSQLVVNTASDNSVLNTLDGCTALIVYKMTDQNSGYSIMSANNGLSFPTTYTSSRGFSELPKGKTDPLDVKTKYGIAIKAYGMYGTTRWFSENNEIDKPNYFYQIDDSLVALAVRHDGAQYLENRNSDGSWNSNIRGYINADEKLISYYYSLSAEARPFNKMNNYEGAAAVSDATKQTSTSNITYYGSYGMPASDAKGGRHGTLIQNNPVTFKNLWTALDKQQKGETLSSEQLGYIKFWNDVNINVASDSYCKDGSRYCDWAYTYQSAKNLASTSKVGNSSYFYFINYIPRDIRKNGNISTFTIGPDFTATTTTRMRVAEVILFAGPLSDEDMNAMNLYLTNKYNISK